MKGSNKRISKKKIFVFGIISILSPFLLIIILELLLRLFDYGNNLDLFIENPNNKDYLVFNPAASKKYFINSAIATTGNQESFKKVKDPNTTRIFVLGESTTIGYPYFHNGSFHRWLQYRLTHSFPKKRFEIINVSLTAVNSYTVLGFAKEITDYQPDAVLIYTGHNEFYGALGVASTDKIGGNQRIINAMLYLRNFRFIQLLTKLYEKTVTKFSPQQQDGVTRMEFMVADQRIPYKSDLYIRAVKQFTNNLDEVFHVFNRKLIPVFVSTIVSNEKDLKPFVSIEPDSIRFPEFKRNLDSGMKLFETGDLTTANSFLVAANHIYPFDAKCNFTLGKIAYQKKSFDTAKSFFAIARDLDGLRFRAPGELNQIIDYLSAKYPNVHLVDTKAAFEQKSENRIVGNELLLEHVHPNLKGYAVMSDAFYESMKSEHFISPDSSTEMSFADLQRQMPITTSDSLSALIRINKLKANWPFNEVMVSDGIVSNGFEGKIAFLLANRRIDWYNAMDTLFNYYIEKNDFNSARTVVEGLTLEHPDDVALLIKTANLYGKSNNLKQAVFYFEKSFDLQPSVELAKTVFVIYLKMDMPATAIPYIDYILRTDKTANLGQVKKYSVEVAQLEEQLAKDPKNLNLINSVTNKYLNMGNVDGATKYNEKAMGIDPKNEEAKSLGKKLLTH